MYPMDRNEKDTCRQSLASSLEALIMHYSFPVCIHNQSGEFPAFNSAFLYEFGGALQSERSWEELIGTDTFLRLRELELLIQIEQSNFHIERCIYINGKQFDFMIEEFVSDGAVHFLWKFGRASNSIKRITRSLPLHADVVNFMRAVKRLDKSEYDFFGFYAGGASHKIMGQFLGLENGSSRNKSSQILTKLNISSRDDAFIVLHLSELLEPVMKNVRDIITRHVNRLL
ncbi:TPA: transcriptional regulator TraJ family protein [Klebsiella pneumoniae]|uniref:transcriptional regulator TraJ family protein n=1 Tax=Klebsiella pneumoniae TaxID=573 RepID=UPI0027EF0CD3|nr:conjugal transfer protein TraJ [Klebsiella pneumoniae subsp. pneumoniae]HDT5900097.1 conjugal transfer protein TraJ [Raoultella ornithinolytica]HDT5917680.1 conjugal transfer protein TraJ [Raoultella ornithinolytica]HDT6018872.1 conjugal transfer protein TraJ [Raoultella ornithinolytica]